ncbi:MAG: hypothetical protein BJ554DRAFT_4633 [Olpidium bornovanus]|uniref:Na+/H+ antiporter NhaC-like C-terminal domain-containing protein n=1 Tax=Olpidium bornovanus TaxID=278681 RepID=A0A8H7ZMG2_9FUNG|nr:MAG: hypothetical protein BJ554DRAFT_4633 [Olpidium bornovanus]
MRLSPILQAITLAAPSSLPFIEKLTLPASALVGRQFNVALDLSWPDRLGTSAAINYNVSATGLGILAAGTLQRADDRGLLLASVVVPNVTVPASGYADLEVRLYDPADPAAFVSEKTGVQVIPGWTTLLPVVTMLSLAILTRQVHVALFNPLTALLRSLDTYMVKALSSPEHTKIILFTFWLSALVALVQRSGGAHGLAKMRPISDAVFVAREKLAFLTHATSAPPSSVVPLSSWIGFEVGLIAEQLKKTGDDSSAFGIIVETLPSRYYSIFMIVFVAIQLAFKKEFGPMLVAERRAHHHGKLLPDGESETVGVLNGSEITNRPHRWYNSVVPIGEIPRMWRMLRGCTDLHAFSSVITVVVVICALFITGHYEALEVHKEDSTVDPFDILTMSGYGDPYGSLIWASFVGSVAATIM